MIIHPPAFLLTFHRCLRYDISRLFLLVIFILVSTGCPESNEQGPGEVQEPLPTTQAPPAQDAPTSPASDENGPAADTTLSSPKEEAQEQLNQAQESVENAEQMLQRAPTGKESDAALSALQQDLISAQALLQTSQEQFRDQQFQLARTQAQEAAEKADAVAQHIEQAINIQDRQSP
jgi:hypothetical protein